jgi:hypothetical protein
MMMHEARNRSKAEITRWFKNLLFSISHYREGTLYLFMRWAYISHLFWARVRHMYTFPNPLKSSAYLYSSSINVQKA